MINHAYVMKPPQKSPKDWVLRNFYVGEYMVVLGEGTPRGQGSPYISGPTHSFHLDVHLFSLYHIFLQSTGQQGVNCFLEFSELL